MPTGKVRFFDADKGFGFISKDDGGDVFVRANVLPAGVTSLKSGQRVEFGVMDGRKGEQALSVRLLEAPPSLSKATRKPPEQMATITEDLIRMLDSLGDSYRHGRHPDDKHAAKTAQLLRRVADELEL
ncbi:MAG: cold-shock protein [Arachnia sp.]